MRHDVAQTLLAWLAVRIVFLTSAPIIHTLLSVKKHTECNYKNTQKAEYLTKVSSSKDTTISSCLYHHLGPDFANIHTCKMADAAASSSTADAAVAIAPAEPIAKHVVYCAGKSLPTLSLFNMTNTCI